MKSSFKHICQWKRFASTLAGIALLLSPCLAQNTPTITSITVNEAGRIVIAFDGDAGEYVVECNDDLATNNWGSLCRLSSGGSSTDVSDPIDTEAGQKFYRIFGIDPSSDSTLAGTIAAEFSNQALSTPSIYADLQTVFGLNFASNEGADLLGADGLSSATRNARVYTAMIGALAKLTLSIMNDTNIFPSVQPDSDDVIDALVTDISDGKLDGKDTGSAIEIGSTGVNLPNLNEQDFIDGLNSLKTEVFTLYNVEFVSSGAGTTSASAPASWGTFYWDSADWQ
ncbi:MAG TPA: hypothetical protein DCX06_04455 [Opitutae bacterium]|nr:hypothetical protein [Opitutae bacterium]